MTSTAWKYAFITFIIGIMLLTILFGPAMWVYGVSVILPKMTFLFLLLGLLIIISFGIGWTMGS